MRNTEPNFAQFQAAPEFVAKRLSLDIVEGICEHMKAFKITRSELARRVNVTPAWVTSFLGAHSNPTIKSIARIAIALGLVPQIHFVSREIFESGMEEGKIQADSDAGRRLKLRRRPEGEELGVASYDVA